MASKSSKKSQGGAAWTVHGRSDFAFVSGTDDLAGLRRSDSPLGNKLELLKAFYELLQGRWNTPVYTDGMPCNVWKSTGFACDFVYVGEAATLNMKCVPGCDQAKCPDSVKQRTLKLGGEATIIPVNYLEGAEIVLKSAQIQAIAGAGAPSEPKMVHMSWLRFPPRDDKPGYKLGLYLVQVRYKKLKIDKEPDTPVFEAPEVYTEADLALINTATLPRLPSPDRPPVVNRHDLSGSADIAVCASLSAPIASAHIPTVFRNTLGASSPRKNVATPAKPKGRPRGRGHRSTTTPEDAVSLEMEIFRDVRKSPIAPPSPPTAFAPLPGVDDDEDDDIDIPAAHPQAATTPTAPIGNVFGIAARDFATQLLNAPAARPAVLANTSSPSMINQVARNMSQLSMYDQSRHTPIGATPRPAAGSDSSIMTADIVPHAVPTTPLNGSAGVVLRTMTTPLPGSATTAAADGRLSEVTSPSMLSGKRSSTMAQLPDIQLRLSPSPSVRSARQDPLSPSTAVRSVRHDPDFVTFNPKDAPWGHYIEIEPVRVLPHPNPELAADQVDFCVKP